MSQCALLIVNVAHCEYSKVMTRNSERVPWAPPKMGGGGEGKLKKTIRRKRSLTLRKKNYKEKKRPPHREKVSHKDFPRVGEHLLLPSLQTLMMGARES